jgi:hypothetical protein
LVFSGSYSPDDVQFLLKPVRLPTVSLLDKERLIQSGARHYSEMLSLESLPEPEYWELFELAMRRNRSRFAKDVYRLAELISTEFADEITLVSLLRAGTPIGALLKRALSLQGRRSQHYSISIIRDRGIDSVALRYILEKHSEASLLFVDGWTGKGVIAEELHNTIRDFNQNHRTRLCSDLYTVADLAGVARFSATGSDYLIPCAILNSVVSGLVSRSVLNAEYVQAGDFHACHFYEEFSACDRSRWFIEQIAAEFPRDKLARSSRSQVEETSAPERRSIASRFEAQVRSRYAVFDRNRIKPGIGESTRALLRRVPERLLVQDVACADVQHLLWLAEANHVPVELASWLPYHAAVIIRSLGQE